MSKIVRVKNSSLGMQSKKTRMIGIVHPRPAQIPIKGIQKLVNEHKRADYDHIAYSFVLRKIVFFFPWS